MAYGVGIRKAIVLTPSDTTIYASGTLFVINSTVAGNVTVRLSDTVTTHVIAVAVGYFTYSYEVIGVNTTGMTATAVYSNLY